MQNEISNIEFIGSLDFDFIENIPNDGTNYQLNFDDPCHENSRPKQLEIIAVAGRHQKLKCIYAKHNLFHNFQMEGTVSCKTYIVLFKSPRDVQQIHY